MHETIACVVTMPSADVRKVACLHGELPCTSLQCDSSQQSPSGQCQWMGTSTQHMPSTTSNGPCWREAPD